ncbi:MAG: bifunctional UDP-N-acetylglucosamine diphosphorylase/glucosamine-1-phosphate N-acetyltransferase GlmU [Synechococcaceae cyanobacterium RL_1_2]|nr:bifunctional UDP-N-acetylglucosamine diphosphorylase/glucosamine-1-phosphate N-acetyltransferase GlmU [Synechococcaceae cyanobacterium RL_1_2]
MAVAVAILAAGKGTRMKSSLPKVLHNLGGKSLVQRVLDSCLAIKPERKIVIIGYEADRVRTALSHDDTMEFVEQKEQLGTGHAIQQLLPVLEGFTGDLLVLNGDVPLLTASTIEKLVLVHQQNKNAATLLTAQLPNPKGYGRVFCDDNNLVDSIVEDRDCTTEQRQNNRINGGIYCFNWPKLAQVLPQLSTNNDQQEYYLTEVVDFLSPVMAMDVEDYQEISGINDRLQLCEAGQILQNRIKYAWIQAGVTMVDPASVTIDETVSLSNDAVIEPQTHLRGSTVIGAGATVGPGCLLENATVGANVKIIFSTVVDSSIAENTTVGPYAHIRGGAMIGAGCRVGNFVEIKKSDIGDQSNVAHLSYLGDSTLESQVNIGAGTITANYDGFNKHQTYIGQGSKIGSNSVLVAPVTLGAEVTVGAGSVITKDVPAGALAIARSRQQVMEGWTPKGLIQKD